MFWLSVDTPQILQSVSSVWKQTADMMEDMARMSRVNPVLSMSFAMGADTARLYRDMIDGMAGDTPIIPTDITQLLGLQKVALSPEDRLETRRIGREEKRGFAGLGPSPTLETL